MTSCFKTTHSDAERHVHSCLEKLGQRHHITSFILKLAGFIFYAPFGLLDGAQDERVLVEILYLN